MFSYVALEQRVPVNHPLRGNLRPDAMNCSAKRFISDDRFTVDGTLI
jgi:hypothetical protein